MSVATRIGTIHIYEVEIDEWQPPLLVAEVEKSKPVPTQPLRKSPKPRLMKTTKNRGIDGSNIQAQAYLGLVVL